MRPEGWTTILRISKMGCAESKVRSKVPSGLKRLGRIPMGFVLERFAPTMMLPSPSSATAAIQLLNVTLTKFVSRDPSGWNCRTRLLEAATIRWSGRMAMAVIAWPNGICGTKDTSTCPAPEASAIAACCDHIRQLQTVHTTKTKARLNIPPQGVVEFLLCTRMTEKIHAEKSDLRSVDTNAPNLYQRSIHETQNVH